MPGFLIDCRLRPRLIASVRMCLCESRIAQEQGTAGETYASGEQECAS